MAAEADKYLFMQEFRASYPACCPRCGWAISSHGHSQGRYSDCPQGWSPAAQAGHLPAQRAVAKAENICPLRTFGGEPSTEHHGHDGWPLSDEEILRIVKAGKKPYNPHDPTSIDQRPYRAFAAKRGPNSD